MPYSMMKVSEVLLLTGHLSGWGKKRRLLGILCVPALNSNGSAITADW